uniref:Uncharacterized protein n=1 Tax=Hemiselmis tepida TaxID=464990 RepID=A0A7S0YZJ6_9CRYP|mmetsp:Transcript_24836/g.63001  ORF Transcript_24836/g.63001 Transcript_24836/m.63001 type:complete len:142 (+) Transcript_24836:249-674(+)
MVHGGDDDGGAQASTRRGSTDDGAFQMGSQQRRLANRRQDNNIPGRMDNADAAMMGGVHRASKMAGLRMWFEGVEGKKGAGNTSSLDSLFASLPYTLPVIAACVLLVVVVAVRILRKHQPNSTSYINAAFHNVKVKSGRRY